MKQVGSPREWKLAFLLLLPWVMPGCPDSAIDLPMESIDPNQALAGSEKKIVSSIEGEEERGGENRSSGSFTRVKEAARFRDKKFQTDYVKGNPAFVAMGQLLVRRILTFTGPTQDYTAPRLLPLDIKELDDEILHMVQRAPRPARKIFFKDLEIYMVFRAAYDSLNQEDRLALINHWKKEAGRDEPPQPKDEAHYPLYWLRTNAIFWDRGGKFWWWAAHVLMEDEGFKIDDKGRVTFVLPHGKGKFSS